MEQKVTSRIKRKCRKSPAQNTTITRSILWAIRVWSRILKRSTVFITSMISRRRPATKGWSNTSTWGRRRDQEPIWRKTSSIYHQQLKHPNSRFQGLIEVCFLTSLRMCRDQVITCPMCRRSSLGIRWLHSPCQRLLVMSLSLSMEPNTPTSSKRVFSE